MYIDLHPEMTNGARDGASGNDDQLTTKAERLHNAHSFLTTKMIILIRTDLFGLAVGLVRERSSGLGVGAGQLLRVCLPPSLIPGHHLPWRFDPGVVARVALGLHSEKAFVRVYADKDRTCARVQCTSLVQGSPKSSQVKSFVICHQSFEFGYWVQ